jgi:hypothetical protein
MLKTEKNTLPVDELTIIRYYNAIMDASILKWQKERLERKVERQAEQITRLETSRRELRRLNKELSQKLEEHD